jgi:hypothetical protein
MTWTCPRCHRAFRQVNQRHACGVGSPGTLLKNRPAALTDIYRKRDSPRSQGQSTVLYQVVQGDNRVAHVAQVRNHEDLRAITPFLREAFNLAASEESQKS